jgi:hypothetical protein
MAMTERDVERARQRMDEQRDSGHAVMAAYDEQTGRIRVDLNTGIQIAWPVALIEGLAQASAADLVEIEISPAGLGLYWPRLDVDIHVPALLAGSFGSKSWMAARLGALGGKAQTPAKADAARANGRKGGRPRKAG